MADNRIRFSHLGCYRRLEGWFMEAGTGEVYETTPTPWRA